jgi:hypothetical protein
VNLTGASAEISDFATQPGGPAFAMLGGNAVGPQNVDAWQLGNGEADIADLDKNLSGLDGVPLYAAYGPLDAVPTESDRAQSWDEAFAQAPAPFGLGTAPQGISPVSSGGEDESVHHYYSYDVTQNGGTLRVIVLDNSSGTLATIPGQTEWLEVQLAEAQAANTPVVVFAALPLDSGESPSAYEGVATDGNAVATQLANAGVLAVFTTSPTQSDQVHMIPYEDPTQPATGQLQIPEYEGAALGYQQPQNNGVLWYFGSVDTVNRTIAVQGIPVVSSLALEPLSGLTAPRSSTLSFLAVGRRPAGSIWVTPQDAAQGNSGLDGIANYVSIPAPSCSSCVEPSYEFTSSNPAVGDFVVPSGPGSQYPKLTATGKTIASATSGLFCAYNAGTTTVSVSSGLLTSSATVTVEPGAIGQPCGTVAYSQAEQVDVIQTKPVVSSVAAPNTNPAGANAPPPVVQTLNPVLPKLALPPTPPPAIPAPVLTQSPAPPQRPGAAPTIAPAPAPSFVAAATAFNAATPVLAPLIPPPITPVPPGGATAPAQSTAKREERARKHARQSAYLTRPAGTSSDNWFYPAVVVMTVAAVMLIAGGVRPGPKRSPAFARLRTNENERRRRDRRRR